MFLIIISHSLIGSSSNSVPELVTLPACADLTIVLTMFLPFSTHHYQTVKELGFFSFIFQSWLSNIMISSTVSLGFVFHLSCYVNKSLQ